MAKTKGSSIKRLYEVRLDGGRSNPEWKNFYEGVTKLNGQSPDFEGISCVAVIGTHHQEATVEAIVSETMDDTSDLSISEITKESLQGNHKVFHDLIDSYFLPYGSYPAVED